ncbi:MAG TPA: hypothetical protein VM658_08945 [bacterium]|nr:hypothetical protein [bacterium]
MLLVPVAATLALNIFYRAIIFDDTYIGLRYAENLARGRGFVWNQGEAVMSITSPLWVLLLGALHWLGFGLTRTAVDLGIFFTCVMSFFIQLLLAPRLRPWHALATGVAVAFFPIMPYVANSGFETGISLAAFFGIIYFVLTGRYIPAGILSGIIMQVRPEGAVIVGLGALLAWHEGRNKALRFIIAMALTVAPWIIYATLTYGTPIPTSIAAKQANHYCPSSTIIKNLFGLMILAAPVSIFALPGLAVWVKIRSELRLVGAWIALYVIGIIFSHIQFMLFVWYLAPLAACWVLAAAWGMDWLAVLAGSRLPARARRAKKLTALAPAAITFLYAGFFLIGAFTYRQFQWNLGADRPLKYLYVAHWLSPRLHPGQSVLVAECGALGYAMIDQKIMDASGLNTPEIFKLCQVARDPDRPDPADDRPVFNTAPCDLKVIQTYQPDYIVTFSLFMHIGELTRIPWLSEHYRRLDPGRNDLADYIILQRKDL